MSTIEELKNITCPICGKLPYIRSVQELSKSYDGDNEYKVHCPNYHLDCGDWKKTELEAWQLWKERTEDITQPDFCFNNNRFAIQNMSLDEMAEFLLRWRRDADDVMSANGKRLTQEVIREWLTKPAGGIYPKGYPDVPLSIHALPSVTPIRPKGQWIDHSDDGYVECPKCGSATNCDDNIADLHFCFSCGADMREVEE